MLSMLRLLSLTVGGFTLWFALTIPVIAPWFKGPGIAVAVMLLIAALVPARIAPRVLESMNGFACGVFAVSLTGYLGPNGPIVPLLIAGMAMNLAVIVLLRFRQPVPVKAFG